MTKNDSQYKYLEKLFDQKLKVVDIRLENIERLLKSQEEREKKHEALLFGDEDTTGLMERVGILERDQKRIMAIASAIGGVIATVFWQVVIKYFQ